VQLPPILVSRRRHSNHLSQLALAVMQTKGHIQEPICVKVDGLGLPLATIDLNARGTDDMVLDSMASEEAMQPESITTRLIAPENWCVIGETEPLRGGLDLEERRACCMRWRSSDWAFDRGRW
jgi:hypothetical protein